MTIRARTLLAGFMLVALVALGSNLALRPQLFEGVLWNAAVDPSSAAAVHLRASSPSQSGAMEYSTQAEVFRFSLAADEDYTLRYATVSVREAGLKLSTTAAAWTVYLVKDGRADFSQPVGYGEQWNDAFLRLRFLSSASVAYLGRRGVATFALVTSILKDPAATETPWLTVNLPDVLPSGMDWAFVAQQVASPWMDVSGAFGAADVSGLPTQPLTKR